MKIGALIEWMNSQKMSAAAVAWMKTLPPTLLVKRTTPLNLAEAFMATSDWEGLRKFCVGTKWDAFEYMRNAPAARALRELGQLQESSQQWKEAVAKVGNRPEQIFGLADLARKWGWQSEAVDVVVAGGERSNQCRENFADALRLLCQPTRYAGALSCASPSRESAAHRSVRA